MSELIKKGRNTLTAGLILLSAAALDSCSKTASPSQSTIAASAHPRETTMPTQDINGLAVGEKVTDIKVITPDQSIGESFAFKPTVYNQAQDLCVIDDETLSEIAGDGLSAGFLITEDLDKTILSIVTFNTSSKVVTGFTPASELKKGMNLLYEAGAFDSKPAYSVYVDSSGNNQGEIGIFIIPANEPLPTATTVALPQ